MPNFSAHQRTKSWVALALSFAAGLVDIAGALTIFDLFTAHISGTSVRMAQRLAEESWANALLAATVVVSFFILSLAGRAVIEAAQRGGFKRVASVTLTIELALLLLVAAIGHWADTQHILKSRGVTATLLAILAGAMGLQTASLTKIGPLTVHTTFITGMVNKLAQLVSLWLFASYDLRFGQHRHDGHLRKEAGEKTSQIRFFLSLWILYVLGAVCGTFAAKAYSFMAFFFPCAILLGVILIDQALPLSIEEEQEQAE